MMRKPPRAIRTRILPDGWSYAAAPWWTAVYLGRSYLELRVRQDRPLRQDIHHSFECALSPVDERRKIEMFPSRRAVKECCPIPKNVRISLDVFAAFSDL
jgi:hypothetical protein